MAYTCTREDIVIYLYDLCDHYYYWTQCVFGLGDDANKRIDIFFHLICALTEEYEEQEAE